MQKKPDDRSGCRTRPPPPWLALSRRHPAHASGSASPRIPQTCSLPRRPWRERVQYSPPLLPPPLHSFHSFRASLPAVSSSLSPSVSSRFPLLPSSFPLLYFPVPLPRPLTHSTLSVPLFLHFLPPSPSQFYSTIILSKTLLLPHPQRPPQPPSTPAAPNAARIALSVARAADDLPCPAKNPPNLLRVSQAGRPARLSPGLVLRSLLPSGGSSRMPRGEAYTLSKIN